MDATYLAEDGKRDYENGRILEESNLHSTVYFHLIEKPRSK